MIFLAITPAGLAEALRTAKPNDHVWCGSEAISEADWAALPSPQPSRFSYSLTGPDAADYIDGAVSTIEEHHPGQTIWVERLPAE
jgi:hypothetical protein